MQPKILSQSFVIRCASPDCDWGHPMPCDLLDWEIHMNKCENAFLRHCVERHPLGEHYSRLWIRLDLVEWTIELVHG
jgi:hypothetical protein